MLGQFGRCRLPSFRSTLLRCSRLALKRLYTSQSPKQSLPLIPSAAIFIGGSIFGVFLYQFRPKQTPEIKPEAKVDTRSILRLEDLEPPVYATEEEVDKAIEEVRSVFMSNPPKIEDESLVINNSKEDRDSHSDTYFNSYHPLADQRPKYVIYPRLTKEVSQIMKIFHKYKVPVTPTSGRSSLEGHFVPTRRGVTIDISAMDKVLKLNKDDLDVTVEGGLGWETLADYLDEYKLLFPIDPGPGASISGCCANNASGTNASRYGECYKNILSLTVVLADGTIIKTKQRPRKTSAGYNLNSMFVGSEGTLGIITEATLKLYVKPAVERVAVVPFETIKDAANAVNLYLHKGIQFNAVELLDDKMMACINQTGETSRKWTEKPTLFLKIGGGSDEVVQLISKHVRELSKEHNCLDFQYSSSEDETLELWSARKVALWSTINQGKLKNDKIQIWTTDAAVPISKLPEFLDETKKDIDSHRLYNTLVAHIGDGNAHSFILYAPEQRDLAEEVVDRMVRRAIDFEGTCTGEHGVGLGKRPFLLEEVGEDAVSLMRRIKLSLDPLRIMNPDKVFKIDPNEK